MESSQEQKIVEESLFSGMLQGISSFTKEILNKGNLQELRLDNGILIILRHPDWPVACILVAEKSSAALRNGLQLFMAEFMLQFRTQLDDPSDVSKFSGAKHILRKYIPI